MPGYPTTEQLLIIPQMLYDDKINFSIRANWDAGFEVKLGDSWNGYNEQGNHDNYIGALEMLHKWVVEHHPKSRVAKL